MVGDSEREIRAGTCAVGKYVRKEGGALGEWEQTMNGAAYMLEKGEEVSRIFNSRITPLS